MIRTPLYLLPAATFLLHVAEEFPRFPAWATRHFGATSRAWFTYSHIPLIAGIVAISGAAAAAPDGSPWWFLSVVTQWILFSNALFHLATTFLFREYSPGVITASALFLPSTYVVANQTCLSREATLIAALLGMFLGALVVASLWLPMNLDWRLRRRV